MCYLRDSVFCCFQEFEIDPDLVKEQKIEVDNKVSAHQATYL